MISMSLAASSPRREFRRIIADAAMSIIIGRDADKLMGTDRNKLKIGADHDDQVIRNRATGRISFARLRTA